MSSQLLDQLAGYGIVCGVVNPRFVKPLDVDLLLLAGGFGSAVLEALAEAGMEDVSVHRIGFPDSFIEHSTADAQRRRLELDADGIAQQVLRAFFPGASPQGNRGPADRETAAG